MQSCHERRLRSTPTTLSIRVPHQKRLLVQPSGGRSNCVEMCGKHDAYPDGRRVAEWFAVFPNWQGGNQDYNQHHSNNGGCHGSAPLASTTTNQVRIRVAACCQREGFSTRGRHVTSTIGACGRKRINTYRSVMKGKRTQWLPASRFKRGAPGKIDDLPVGADTGLAG